MKKYNLSKIMKRAWEMVKGLGLTISEALKRAWSEAKTVKEKFQKCAKIQKDGLGNSPSNFLTFNRWEKYGKKRIYINDYKGRAIGYIEDGSFKRIDNIGNHTEVIDNAVATFMAKYEF